MLQAKREREAEAKRLAAEKSRGRGGTLKAAPQSGTARADANALEKIVLGKCVPDEVEAGKPAPCATVDLAGRYAVLKDLVGASQYLLIPTDKVEGIEDPVLLQSGTPNYFEDAWQSRTLMDKSLGRPVPRDVVGLAINSVKGRSQNQLHIHIDCVRRGVLDTLVHDSGAIGTTWAPLPDKLAGHAYQAMRIEAVDLSGTSPFALLANGQPAVAGDMADETLVAVAESLPDGSEGFYLLADKVDLAQGDFGFTSGRAAATALLGGPIPPSAIIASNDQMALATLELARERGLSVPADLSIVSFDDTPIVRFAHPPLTAVVQPIAAVTARAVELIIDAKAGRPLPDAPVVVPATLVVRASTTRPHRE